MATARILHGPNDTALTRLRQQGAVFDLAYLDPPFFTQREHKTSDGEIAYDDRWSNLEEYFDALRATLYHVLALLAPHGTMILHLNDRVVHHARIECDSVFGSECFRNEIIWRYRRWPSPTRNFQRMHDTLLRYIRSPLHVHRWNQLYEPLAESTKTKWGTKKQKAVFCMGRRASSHLLGEDSPGPAMSDVWDIPLIAPSCPERTGYPTQKPEALLERIILSMSHEGDAVLDPYMGSGTTLAVAQRLGRRSVGIDQSALAIKTASARLGVDPERVS